MKKYITATAGLLLSANVMAADLSTLSWDEIVAQGKEEGSVNWFVWYFGDKFKEAVKPFEEKYGINVVIPEGGEMNTNLDKFIAEQSRETGDIDVLPFGFEVTEKFELPTVFVKVKDLLPKDDGRIDKVGDIDGAGYVYAYWGNQSGIAYDPTKVNAASLPQTPAEFAAFWEANPKKFGFNYEKGGSGPSFFHNVLRVLSPDVDFSSNESSPEKIAGLQAGMDFFNQNYRNYVVTTSNVDSISRLSDKELWMVPAWEDQLAGLQRSGEIRKEIKFYIPSMGMNGGGNGVAVPINAPHPAAALVFMNWLLSPETQSYFNATFGAAPMNTKADDSHALITNDMRKYRTSWAKKPFIDEMTNAFIEQVILAN